MTKTDWDSPRVRAELMRKLGRQEYQRQYEEHLSSSIVATENGYPIRMIRAPRGGPMYVVVGLGRADYSLEGAQAIARDAPKAGAAPKVQADAIHQHNATKH